MSEPHVVDLRSDTLTQPGVEMRQVIAQAVVGDDVFGEDPTINGLQEYVAGLFHKEAALFVPSGTMGNQISIKCHTQPGDEVICEENSHCYNYEAGTPAFFSGVQMRPVAGKDAVITADQIKERIRPTDHHFPQTRLVVLENTHNRAGGMILPLENIQSIYHVCKQYNLSLHLDGARIWNAHIATGIPLEEYGKYFDSMSVCLSKGLGAPVGSLVLGSADFINKAHRFRKILGGGMRQAGVLAAAGLYAVKNNLSRLAIDHEHAGELAQSLARFDSVYIDPKSVKTNIVIVECHKNVDKVVSELKTKGVLAVPFGGNKIRFVTHLNLSKKDIEKAIDIFKQVF